jgi:hypothetical protein
MTIGIMLSGLALLAVLGAGSSRPAAAATTTTRVVLSPGAGVPTASGKAELQLEATVLEGSATVEDLPSQPFGSGHFYGVWFVRTDTGDKAFLGALIEHSSIIFSQPGDGKLRFAATKFTTGPDAGSPIHLGSTGHNLIIVLIENSINGKTPSPVGPVPGSGVAVSGTF